MACYITRKILSFAESRESEAAVSRNREGCDFQSHRIRLAGARGFSR